MSGVFEAILFAELHWKLDVMRSIEKMILGLSGDDNQQTNLRNIYFMKCADTVDEFLASLLYI